MRWLLAFGCWLCSLCKLTLVNWFIGPLVNGEWSMANGSHCLATCTCSCPLGPLMRWLLAPGYWLLAVQSLPTDVGELVHW